MHHNGYAYPVLPQGNHNLYRSDERIFVGRRPFGFGRPFFGGPFVGGLVGGLVGSALFSPFYRPYPYYPPYYGYGYGPGPYYGGYGGYGYGGY